MEKLLELDNVSKIDQYGRTILHDCSFSLCEGERAVILGNRGAGKTTLASVIYGMSKPSTGNIQRKKREDQTNLCAYLPEYPSLCEELTVEEQCLFAMTNQKHKFMSKAKWKKEVKDYLEKWELLRYRNYKNKHLSLFQKCQVLFALQMIRNPELILLDDCFTGLQEREVERLSDYIEKNVDKKAVVYFGKEAPKWLEKEKQYEMQYGILVKV